MEVYTIKFLEYLTKLANGMEDDAGFAGEWGDGGASELRDQIEVYRAGMKGIIPEVWTEYADDYDKENDPEYQKYLRLKAKFDK